jgi:polygalacturonase
MKKYLILILSAVACEWTCAQPASDPWSAVPAIAASIKAPLFPDKEFLITAYGAKGDASTDCTIAIAKAIEACNKAGGGRVEVPAGKFLSGPIHLLSNVNLHLSKDAVILFSQDTKKYLPQVLTRFEGVELMNYSPFIYAFEKENIAITGEGELNGQADGQHWWFWKGKWEDMERMGVTWKEGTPTQSAANARLKELAKQNTSARKRIFGEGDYLRPNFIQPYNCRNVLIEGITIRNSPMWVIHPVLCNNVTVRNVKIDSHGPNNDGCDPESCSNVLIEGCTFDTGDDCIAIKSGRDDDGRRINKPTENVIIRGCTMKDGHGGVVIGSEITGNVRNVFAEKCDMNSPNLDRVLRIKSNSRRGGRIENIFMRDCSVGVVADAVFLIELFYAKETGENHPVVRNVQMANVHSKKSKYALRLEGEEQYPVEDITVENCTFENVAKENSIKGVKSINIKNVAINGHIQ